MTSCTGLRLPREDWEAVFHPSRGEVDASVLDVGIENVEPSEVLQYISQYGKHLSREFAQLSLHSEQYSICRLSAVLATAEDAPIQPEIPEAGVNTVVTIMPGVYTED